MPIGSRFSAAMESIRMAGVASGCVSAAGRAPTWTGALLWTVAGATLLASSELDGDGSAADDARADGADGVDAAVGRSVTRRLGECRAALIGQL